MGRVALLVLAVGLAVALWHGIKFVERSRGGYDDNDYWNNLRG
jgi:hypothetical protein